MTSRDMFRCAGTGSWGVLPPMNGGGMRLRKGAFKPPDAAFLDDGTFRMSTPFNPGYKLGKKRQAKVKRLALAAALFAAPWAAHAQSLMMPVPPETSCRDALKSRLPLEPTIILVWAGWDHSAAVSDAAAQKSGYPAPVVHRNNTALRCPQVYSRS